MDITPFALKLGLLAAWALWFLVATLTNLFDALKALGMLPAAWKFASRNLQAVAKATSGYHPPRWLPGLLFGGVIAWQMGATALLARAFAASLRLRALDWPAVNSAFAAGLALWAAFMLADEISKRYAEERAHVLLFIAQLLTLASLHLLPG